jgi:peroxiredoxin
MCKNKGEVIYEELRSGHSAYEGSQSVSRGILLAAMAIVFIAPIGLAGDTTKSAPSEKTYPKLALGEKAPDFEVPIVRFDNGEPIVTTVRLAELVAKSNVMLCFVSDAGGAAFRPWTSRVIDDAKVYTNGDVLPIFIISADPGSPIYFKKEFRFPFHITADSNGDIIRAYGLPDGESLEVWQRGKSQLSQVCLIDRDGIVRYWCSPFVLKEDYEYVAYRAQLLRRPPDDAVLMRLEAVDRERESRTEPPKPKKDVSAKKNG